MDILSSALAGLAGAAACVLALPANVLLYDRGFDLSIKQVGFVTVTMIPSALLSYYSQDPWSFMLGGLIVTTIPPSLAYVFLFAFCAGSRGKFDWQQQNRDWRRRVLLCSLSFWPLAALCYWTK